MNIGFLLLRLLLQGYNKRESIFLQKEDRLSFCINLKVAILEVAIQRSYFGRIHDTIYCFRDLLTFRYSKGGVVVKEICSMLP